MLRSALNPDLLLDAVAGDREAIGMAIEFAAIEFEQGFTQRAAEEVREMRGSERRRAVAAGTALVLIEDTAKQIAERMHTLAEAVACARRLGVDESRIARALGNQRNIIITLTGGASA
jgi:hypothetical protein